MTQDVGCLACFDLSGRSLSLNVLFQERKTSCLLRSRASSPATLKICILLSVWSVQQDCRVLLLWNKCAQQEHDMTVHLIECSWSVVHACMRSLISIYFVCGVCASGAKEISLDPSTIHSTPSSRHFGIAFGALGVVSSIACPCYLESYRVFKSSLLLPIMLIREQRVTTTSLCNLSCATPH